MTWFCFPWRGWEKGSPEMTYKRVFAGMVFLICIFVIGCGDRAGGVNIWSAVANNDGDGIRRYAQAGGDIDVRDRSGQTPLLMAFQRKQFNSYRTLLKLGADPNVEADNGDAVMVYVACTRDSKWLREALARGGNPDYFNTKASERHRGTALLSAIHAHCPENAILLIESGADINFLPAEEPTRETPLVATLGTNQFDITLQLLEAGADYRSTAGEDEFVPLLKKRLHMTYRSKAITSQRAAVIAWLKKRGVEFEDDE